MKAMLSTTKTIGDICLKDVTEIILDAGARENVKVVSEVDYMGNRKIRITCDNGRTYDRTYIE